MVPPKRISPEIKAEKLARRTESRKNAREKFLSSAEKRNKVRKEKEKEVGGGGVGVNIAISVLRTCFGRTYIYMERARGKTKKRLGNTSRTCGPEYCKEVRVTAALRHSNKKEKGTRRGGGGEAIHWRSAPFLRCPFFFRSVSCFAFSALRSGMISRSPVVAGNWWIIYCGIGRC